MRFLIAMLLILSQFGLTQAFGYWESVFPFMYSGSYTLGICQGMGI